MSDIGGKIWSKSISAYRAADIILDDAGFDESVSTMPHFRYCIYVSYIPFITIEITDILLSLPHGHSSRNTVFRPRASRAYCISRRTLRCMLPPISTTPIYSAWYRL